MAEKVISVKDFSFSYGTKNVLENISFNITEGEYVALIGPNGAGKSTLLKSLNRILCGGKGVINLFDKGLLNYSQKELGRLIGYVSQNREDRFPYTVFEFVLMGRYPYLHPLAPASQKDKHIVQEALAMTNTEAFAQRKVNSLSGGERQKVYIAAALAQEPRILLLDEPTTHLDPKYQVEIQEMLFHVCKQLKITVLHVTHEFNHIIARSQRMMALKDGRLVFNDRPEVLMDKEKLREIFDTEFCLLTEAETGQRLVFPRMKI